MPSDDGLPTRSDDGHDEDAYAEADESADVRDVRDVWDVWDVRDDCALDADDGDASEQHASAVDGS